MTLKKPKHLSAGDTIASVSVSHGWAGEPDMIWKYELGKKRLEDIFGLKVLAAPNSMKGFEYLKNNPQARAEDILWAFDNKNIKAIIANIGGNDSIKTIPFIDTDIIRRNPKIFIGYSDVMNIHILCYKTGLTTFYGHNLLSTIAEAQGFHPYSQKWFAKVLFDPSPIGTVEPSDDWTNDDTDYYCKDCKRNYYPNSGYELIQGQGIVCGKLIGGHTGLSELENEVLALSADDFDDSILFIEDIPEFFSPNGAANFFKRLGNKGILQRVNGIIIGKLKGYRHFGEHGRVIKSVMRDAYGFNDLPILYGLNFGHTSPIFILPYGAKAEINCEFNTFSILESGVI